jgi:hypothetical protein
LRRGAQSVAGQRGKATLAKSRNNIFLSLGIARAPSRTHPPLSRSLTLRSPTTPRAWLYDLTNWQGDVYDVCPLADGRVAASAGLIDSLTGQFMLGPHANGQWLATAP